MDISIRGLTNPTGFKIIDFDNNIVVKSEGYSDNDENWPKLLKMICKIIYFDRRKTIWLWAIIEKFLSVKYIRDTSEWHACEHKLIKLIVKHQKITFEMLSKEPDTTEYCGRQNRYLKEPKKEKIKETLRVAEEYYKKLSSERAV